jgi:hypothetical protein
VLTLNLSRWTAGYDICDMQIAVVDKISEYQTAQYNPEIYQKKKATLDPICSWGTVKDLSSPNPAF